jgi:hypothetical protein
LRLHQMTISRSDATDSCGGYKAISDVQEISEQMERIQNELGSLTMLEMKKRDLKVKEEKAHDGRHFVLKRKLNFGLSN